MTDRIRNGVRISSISGPTRVGCIWPSVSISILAECRLGSAGLDEEGACDLCLAKAIAIRQPTPGLIQRAYRGSQYARDAYRKIRNAHNVIPSMSGKGNCYDTAMVDTVRTTIKAELLWRTASQSRDDAIKAIGAYIDGFYTPVRRHSAIGYRLAIAHRIRGNHTKIKHGGSPQKLGQVQCACSKKDATCLTCPALRHAQDGIYIG